MIELSTTYPRRSKEGVNVYRVRQLDRCDLQMISSLPVTNASRTLFDLAGVIDEETLEIAMDHCLNQRLTSMPRLRWTLQRLGRNGRAGSKMFRQLINARKNGYVPTQSPLETKVASRVLRILERAGLPAPNKQHVIKDRGNFVAQVDFAYPHAKVVIEVQSVKHHAGRRGWERDMTRFGDLASLGWRVIPLLYDDTGSRVKAAIERIRRAIEDPKLLL